MRAVFSLLGAVVLSWATAPDSAQQFHMEPNLDPNLADARLLRNIEPFQTATASLLRRRPVRYQVQSPISGALLGPLRLGFVAQQLHTVYLGIVSSTAVFRLRRTCAFYRMTLPFFSCS